MGRLRRRWSREEDALLRKVVNESLAESKPLLWRELAKDIPGRSNKDCRRRWWNSLADGTAKGLWSETEDSKLLNAVRELGTSWRLVAQQVGSRTPDQCASHWTQVLDPGINHCEWTESEDSKLFKEVMTHGTNWTTIASSHSPKRTTLALKNRYATLRVKTADKKKTRPKKSTICVKSKPKAVAELPWYTTIDNRSRTGVEDEEEEYEDDDESSLKETPSFTSSPRTDDSDNSPRFETLEQKQQQQQRSNRTAVQCPTGAKHESDTEASLDVVMPAVTFPGMVGGLESISCWPGVLTQAAFPNDCGMVYTAANDKTDARINSGGNLPDGTLYCARSGNNKNQAFFPTSSPELGLAPTETYGYFGPSHDAAEYNCLWGDMLAPVSSDASFSMCDSPAPAAVPRTFGVYCEQLEAVAPVQAGSSQLSLNTVSSTPPGSAPTTVSMAGVMRSTGEVESSRNSQEEHLGRGDGSRGMY